MTSYKWLLLLNFIHLCRTECVIDHRSLTQAWEEQLHKDLKSCYMYKESPSNNNTEVKIWFLVKHFHLNSDDIFSVFSWTSMKWKDERLKWDPSKYGNITKTTFYSYRYWTPILEQKNRIADEYKSFYGQCRVNNNGSVLCVPRFTDKVHCTTILTDWPYDIQRCKMEYGILQVKKYVYLVPDSNKAVTMNGAQYGSGWTIVSYDQKVNVSDSVQLQITYVLERNIESLGAIMVFPLILHTVLTASLILMDVKDNNRLFMMTFGVLCHWLYLKAIGWEIPKQSETTPTILIFFRFSLIYNLFLLVLTLVLSEIRNRKTVPPPWICAVRSFVLKSYGKYFIWPRWETNADFLTSASYISKGMEVWTGIANIINSVCLFVTIFVYCIMLLVLVPRSAGLALKLQRESFI